MTRKYEQLQKHFVLVSNVSIKSLSLFGNTDPVVLKG